MEEFENCGAVKEQIDLLEDESPPLDSPEYEEFKEKFNKLVEIYNNCVNFTAYKKNNLKKEQTDKLTELFLWLWTARGRKSEISKKYLGREALRSYFHHILPKKKYPQAALDPENIIILSIEEHDQVEIKPNRYEEINKRREQLKTKYNII